MIIQVIPLYYLCYRSPTHVVRSWPRSGKYYFIFNVRFWSLDLNLSKYGIVIFVEEHFTPWYDTFWYEYKVSQILIYTSGIVRVVSIISSLIRDFKFESP